MKNIRNYDEFTNEGLLDWGKSVLHKAMTTDKQRDTKAAGQEKAKTGKINVEDKDIKSMKTETTPVVSKVGRLVKGDNAFIDTKSGEIIAMDLLLSEKEMSDVVEKWKAGDRKGAASILKNFAVRERNLQFNLAVGLMMSALCLGAGACVPHLKAQVNQSVPVPVTEVIPTEGIGYKNALLKFYQALGDKVGIGNGNKFIQGSASKEDLFKLFDTLAKKSGLTTDDFMKQMFSKTHGGNMDMVTKEINYLSKCKADSAIKTVGQIFNKTTAQDMTGIKGFNPFGISSPENAKSLQSFFNGIEGIGKETITKISNVVKSIVSGGGDQLSPADTASMRGLAGGAAASPSYSGEGVDKKQTPKKESIKSFDKFIKLT